MPKPCFINKLPDAITSHLFSFLDSKSILSCNRINTKFNRLIYPKLANTIYDNGIGCDKWNHLMKKISSGTQFFTESELKEERALRSPDINAIVKQHIKVFTYQPSTSRKDRLIYIPKTINGEPLTLNFLSKMMNMPYPQIIEDCGYFADVINPLKSMSKSQWLIVTEIISKTSNQTFSNSIARVDQNAKNSEDSEDNTLLNALATTAILAIPQSTGKWISMTFNHQGDRRIIISTM